MWLFWSYICFHLQYLIYYISQLFWKKTMRHIYEYKTLQHTKWNLAVERYCSGYDKVIGTAKGPVQTAQKLQMYWWVYFRVKAEECTYATLATETLHRLHFSCKSRDTSFAIDLKPTSIFVKFHWKDGRDRVTISHTRYYVNC